MPDFKKVTAVLRRHYGDPELLPARGPFELILWENACYLLSDERRAKVFEGLRAQVGLDPKAILKAPQATLLALAKLGGMQPETRVIRWREIARITVNQFGGDLDRILREPYENAKKALKAFPSIGDPGAEKILLFSGVHRGLPLESNGLRVLTRVGFGRVQKSYSSTYRSVQEALQDKLPGNGRDLLTAHLLLRLHGKKYCRNNSPLCRTCPLSVQCAYPLK